MYVQNLVICDQEQQYAKNLLQMFSRQKEAMVQLYLFHTLEELIHFSRQKKIHILLIGEEYPVQKREQIPAEDRFVLVKGGRDDLTEDETGIYRYQCADEIWRQIVLHAAEEGTCKRRMEAGDTAIEVSEERTEHPAHPVTQTKGELIGVYSPIHRIGKTRFALELGKKLAEKEPVIYLNLEEYSGSNYYFPEQTGQNLGDLLYYVRQEKGNLGLRISMMAGQDGNLDYILPMPYAQDLQAVKTEEWLRLFGQILDQCIYEKVILDLGDSIDGLFEILRNCSVIYTPYIEEEAACAKLSQYVDNLRRTGLEEVLEKTIQKKMRQEGT